MLVYQRVIIFVWAIPQLKRKTTHSYLVGGIPTPLEKY
jgi:hypothetical protein